MGSARTVVLATSADLIERVTSLAGSLEWTSARGLEFHLLSGDLQSKVAEWREQAPGIPLGVLVGNETEVLTALSGGADEAAVLREVSGTELGVFLDRLSLRAQMRAEGGRMQRRFADAEKLAALGTLVAGVGHEINNPLSVVMLSIESLRRHAVPIYQSAWDIGRAALAGKPLPKSDLAHLAERTRREEDEHDDERILDEMSGAVDAIALIVRDLRTFARTGDEDVPELVAVSELIDQSIRLAGGEIFPRGVLEQSYPPDLPKLVVPRNRVMQVIMNVLVNASHALREVERPIHRVRISALADEEFVAITISDTGPGIPPESIERIFDPFFTTKRQDMGTGLGLAISRSILRRLGGDITVESVYGEGATFLCFLPVPTGDAVSAAWERPPARTSSATRRIGRSVLLVDSDNRVLRSYARLLHNDYRLVIAQDSEEAIELIESGSAPDVAVVEVSSSSGRRLLDWLLEHQGALASRTVVVTSASGEDGDPLGGFSGATLRKPVRGDELVRAIEAALEGAPDVAVGESQHPR